MSPRLSLSELFLRAQTDERLAALAGDGHGRAFAVLIERHRRVLLGHARRLVGPERSEDVVQQALLRAWSALEGGTEVRHPSAWLHRIVHRAALADLARHSDTTLPLDEALAAADTVELAAERRLELEAVLAGVAALPERQRLALLGLEIEGRSRRQLASDLDLTEGAVRQLVHRARAGVRTAVAAVLPWPVVARAIRGSQWLGERAGNSGAGRPTGVLAGPALGGGAVKVGAVLLAGAAGAVGAVGGGIAIHSDPAGRHRSAHASVRRSAEPAPASIARAAVASVALGGPMTLTTGEPSPRSLRLAGVRAAAPSTTGPSRPAAPAAERAPSSFVSTDSASGATFDGREAAPARPEASSAETDGAATPPTGPPADPTDGGADGGPTVAPATTQPTSTATAQPATTESAPATTSTGAASADDVTPQPAAPSASGTSSPAPQPAAADTGE